MRSTAENRDKGGKQSLSNIDFGNADASCDDDLPTIPLTRRGPIPAANVGERVQLFGATERAPLLREEPVQDGEYFEPLPGLAVRELFQTGVELFGAEARPDRRSVSNGAGMSNDHQTEFPKQVLRDPRLSAANNWRHRPDIVELAAAQPQPRDSEVKLRRRYARLIARLTRERNGLRVELDKARRVIEFQKKIGVMLGLLATDINTRAPDDRPS
jgi:hypothetical protein